MRTAVLISSFLAFAAFVSASGALPALQQTADEHELTVYRCINAETPIDRRRIALQRRGRGNGKAPGNAPAAKAEKVASENPDSDYALSPYEPGSAFWLAVGPGNVKCSTDAQCEAAFDGKIPADATATCGGKFCEVTCANGMVPAVDSTTGEASCLMAAENCGTAGNVCPGSYSGVGSAICVSGECSLGTLLSLPCHTTATDTRVAQTAPLAPRSRRLATPTCPTRAHKQRAASRDLYIIKGTLLPPLRARRPRPRLRSFASSSLLHFYSFFFVKYLLLATLQCPLAYPSLPVPQCVDVGQGVGHHGTPRHRQLTHDRDEGYNEGNLELQQ